MCNCGAIVEAQEAEDEERKAKAEPRIKVRQTIR
jgi:hypothetical protein